jgi:hypothetical protein
MYLSRKRKHKNITYEQIYKLQVLLETYKINVKIIVFEKKIKKAHLNIFYFLIINLTKLELTKL